MRRRIPCGQRVRLKHKAFIEELVEKALKTGSAEHWLAELERARIPCARVNNIAQALADPQVLHRKMVVDVQHPEHEQVQHAKLLVEGGEPKRKVARLFKVGTALKLTAITSKLLEDCSKAVIQNRV